MIITRTPVRISLFGGGTDYPTWLNAGNTGIVFGGAINKYSYITCRYLPPFNDYYSYLSYSKVETVKANGLIEHNVIRETLSYFNVDEGIEIAHLADIPSKTGTGSSSTFLVGLINAICTLKGDEVADNELARLAIDIEQNYLKESVGYQDSMWAAFGGFNTITFEGNKFSIYRNKGKAIRDLEKNLMLFFTGIRRRSSDVASTYVPSLAQKEYQQKRTIELTNEAINYFNERKFDKIGELLDTAWSIKKSISSNISNGTIDAIYDRAKRAGALGGKVTGAGGGGSLILYVPKEKQKSVAEELSDLIRIPFKFTDKGSEVILKNGE